MTIFVMVALVPHYEQVYFKSYGRNNPIEYKNPSHEIYVAHGRLSEIIVGFSDGYSLLDQP